MKTYNELLQLRTFQERLEYLKTNSKVGQDTFGFNRYLNQKFYKSKEWKDLRNFIIIRDNGCDMGLLGYEIYDNIIIHHIEVITPDDLLNDNFNKILDPNNLISVSHDTHNAIHYGTNIIQNRGVIERKINDTCPWKG